MAIDLHQHSAQEASNITSRRAVIRVTPTITGVQYSNNDVLFTTTEIPEAVGYTGGASKLINITINSKSASLFDCTLWFFQVNQSAGTVNSAWSMSDSDFGTAKNLGCLSIMATICNKISVVAEFIPSCKGIQDLLVLQKHIHNYLYCFKQHQDQRAYMSQLKYKVRMTQEIRLPRSALATLN